MKRVLPLPKNLPNWSVWPMSMRVANAPRVRPCLVVHSFLEDFLQVLLLSFLLLKVLGKRLPAVPKDPNGMISAGAPSWVVPLFFGVAGPLVSGDLGFEGGIL
ncbi:hypothetical protein VTN00DRAFT_5689 [Thermoascus crustaceus]|uniref:uncharacterized protein n=1 Tax=Thermoascus crustaceus TaxID=5088 RepID=UPI003742EAFA